MSKVVCEVCGTAYAETSNQCPICGTAKPDQSQNVNKPEGEGYAYVKGGRFSPANVKKRNSGNQESTQTKEEPKPRREQKQAPVERQPRAARKEQQEPENEQPSNIGLIIVVVVLLLAIISLCAYIAIRYINLSNSRNETGSTESTSQGQIVEEVPCTGISIPGMTEYTFKELTDSWQVEVICTPEDTTDMISWEYDKTVVTVTPNGNYWVISPVGPGETRIVIKCGEHTAYLTVISEVVIEPEPTDPEPTDPEPTDPEFVLELRKTDITLSYYEETARIYNGSLDASKITWSSDNEDVATVENGVVTAIGAGTCKIYAAYGDQTAICIVRCTKDVVAPVDTGYYLAHQYNTGVAATDATISVGEKLVFSIRTKDGTKVTEGVTFTVSDENYITVDANGRVTGVAVTRSDDKSFYVYVYAEYEGVVYECKIRVKAAA